MEAKMGPEREREISAVFGILNNICGSYLKSLYIAPLLFFIYTSFDERSNLKRMPFNANENEN